MEIKGLCHICGELATTTCRMCGKPVCKKDMDSRLVCKSCAAGRKA